MAGSYVNCGVYPFLPVNIEYGDGGSKDLLPVQINALRLDITLASAFTVSTVVPQAALGINRTMAVWLLTTSRGSNRLDVVQERYFALLQDIYDKLNSTSNSQVAVLGRVLYNEVKIFQNV